MKAHNLPRSGFTLIELLVVIAIVGILAAFLLPSLKGMLEQGTTAKCSSHMKQVAAAALLFAAENDGKVVRVHVRNADAKAIVSPFPLPDSKRITMNPNAYFWQDILLQYASDSKIYSCPKLTLPATQATGGGKSSNCPLGIGINTEISKSETNSDGSSIWVRMIQVPQPSLIVWFADAGMDEKGEASGPWSERKDAPRTGMSFFRGSSNEPGTCVMPRHKGRINVAFADGHVATVTPDQINWGGNSTTKGGTNYIGFSDLP